MLKYCFTCAVLCVLSYPSFAQVNFEISNVKLVNKKVAKDSTTASISLDVQNTSPDLINEPIDIWFSIDENPAHSLELTIQLPPQSSATYQLSLPYSFPEETFHLRIHAESKDQTKRSNRLNRMVVFSDHSFSFTDLNFGWEMGNPDSEATIMGNEGAAEELVVYNFLTPNNDGKNDVLMIENLPVDKDSKLSIYSLDGQLIYEQINYQNDWAGTLRSGQKIPKGQVVYSLEYDGAILKKGYITIDY